MNTRPRTSAPRMAPMAAMLAALVITGAAVAAEPAAPASGAASASASAPGAAADGAPFATVGTTVITVADYRRALSVAMRKKYYHAKPPEAEYAKFQREVADELVNRTLLLAEAQRRRIEPDRQKIEATIAGYDAQYRNSANWQANRSRMLAAVTPQLEKDSLLERLEQQVKTGPKPKPAEARQFYERNRKLFMEPEQVKLSVILLKVDPSSPQAVWNSALAEGRSIHQRLKDGADFNELARLHSGDRSAAQGGQMEYTHRGMLPQAVQEIVDKLTPGQLAEPTQLLEGVVLLRLDGRKASQQRSFDAVQERATELLQRERAESRWTALIAGLRKTARIRIDESHYVPLGAAGAVAPGRNGRTRRRQPRRGARG